MPFYVATFWGTDRRERERCSIGMDLITEEFILNWVHIVVLAFFIDMMRHSLLNLLKTMAEGHLLVFTMSRM